MKGIYFEYNGNVFKVKGYNAYKESIDVKLIKQNTDKLCSNEEHARWIEEGGMWPSEFFEKGRVIPNGSLLYGKK